MLAHIPLHATDADVWRISEANPGWRVERTPEGEITLTPPAGSASSHRNARLTSMLHEWAERHGYVAFDSSGGFLLSDGSIVSPDGALIPRATWDRLSEEDREGFIPMAPTVALELVSKTDNPAELRQKLARLRSDGTVYVVLVDPYHNDVWTDGERPDDFDLDFRPLLK